MSSIYSQSGNKTDTDLNFKIAVCYLNTDNDKTAAISHLEEVIKTTPDYTDVNYELGRAYFHKHQFDKSSKYFESYISEKNTDPDRIAKIEEIKRNINNAKELIKNPIDVTFINLGKSINTKRAEKLPFVNYDESKIVYTSNKKYSYRIY